MKFKTTAKAIRQSGGKKLSINYCGAQYLLRNHAPVAYTCGVYGWNFDVYSVDGVTICTGYRGMVGSSPNWAVLQEYENRARAIWENRDLPYDDRAAQVETLLHEFLSIA